MMDEEDEHLLRELGRHVRAQERDPEALRLERLCRGELASDEQAELDAAASADPELAARVQAHVPLSPEMRAQIAARVLATVRANPPEARAGARGQNDTNERAEPRAQRDTEAQADQAHVAERSRGSRVVRVLWLAAPLSAAAGFFLWMATARSPTGSLPSYSLEIAGGQAELRGPAQSEKAPSAPIAVGPNTELTLVLRPATEVVRAEISAAVFLVPAAGDPVPWPAQVVKASSGALRIALAPPPRSVATRAQARIIVADAKLLQERSAALARGEPTKAHDFQRFVLELTPAIPP